MKSHYTALYLSPHLDDAVFSCGGQIYQQTQAGGLVLIVSIMSGDAPSDRLSAFAQTLHDRWQLAADASSQRRQEDRAACHVVGADYRHFDLLDCIYRQDPAVGVALYESEQALFGELHPAERALAEALADTLAQLPDADRVFAPLTAGHHVDHQLVRLAAEIWRGPNRLIYYEDYPYAQSPLALPAERAVEGAWRSSVIELSRKALAARIEAMACYRSQLSTFFRDHEELASRVTEYTQEVGGERLWRRIAP